MLDCFPERQQALLAQLEQHPDQQFSFLKSLLAIQQCQQQGGINGSSNTPLKVGGLLAACLGMTCAGLVVPHQLNPALYFLPDGWHEPFRVWLPPADQQPIPSLECAPGRHGGGQPVPQAALPV